MREITLDTFDRAILDALQRDSSQTSAELGKAVNLSASQCSRRRARLEEEGVIAGYSARLDPGALGLRLRAIARVTLSSHSEENAKAFAAFLDRFDEVRSAFSVSGDADYVLLILARDLEAFSDFVHRHLLPHPAVAQVRSEVVLTTLKENAALPLG